MIPCFTQDAVSFVNPFIGTDKSEIKTKWGQYGGTFPGAVSPWGMVQLSPETRDGVDKGYFYCDSSIIYFTCLNHNSGYPNGSHGNIRVNFIQGVCIDNMHEETRQYFHHNNETASPGYYGVQFNNKSKIEMTTTTHAGMFRFTPVVFPFVVSISDAGNFEIIDNKTISISRNHGFFIFNTAWSRSQIKDGELLLEFNHLSNKDDLLVKTGFSFVDKSGSLQNIMTEIPHWNFDIIRNKTLKTWDKELSVVKIKGGNSEDLTKFYTALYHSFLLPQIVSDVDGKYRGNDKKIYMTNRNNIYNRFSPWDTFRTLHPLLTLLKPERQLDILHSMLNIYDQTGNLPLDPMIGYHALAIFSDSYRKGITGFDTEKAFQAMRKCLIGNEMPRKNIVEYIRNGYLDDSLEESVSVTLDYAYNDWTLSVFAGLTGHSKDEEMLLERSFNYRNLFDVETSFMLPYNNETGFNRTPGEAGYKESNKWMASWFVPHNVQDLINLTGGDDRFVDHLQKGYQNDFVIHDNEPVLNYPFLFSYAGRPDLTLHWVSIIRDKCYTINPGGIPGNDDLGSMSSWFVFSSMGIFPVCPGSQEYILTLPLFQEICIDLENGNSFHISTDRTDKISQFPTLNLNGEPFSQLYVNHDEILKGGLLKFNTSHPIKDYGELKRPSSVTSATPDFQITDIRCSKQSVIPNQETYFYYTIKSNGATGTFQAILKDENDTISFKNTLIRKNETQTDSLPFRLYRNGKHLIELSSYSEKNEKLEIKVMNVIPDFPIICKQIKTSPLVRIGDVLDLDVELQNISGNKKKGILPVFLNDASVTEITYALNAGERKHYHLQLSLSNSGVFEIKIQDQSHTVKVYESNLESSVLDVNFDIPGKVFDHSGFGNHGEGKGSVQWVRHEGGNAIQIDENSYINFPLTESLNISGKTITLSIWLYPIFSRNDQAYIDFFTKGDYTVLKINAGNLTFFAGGWGRGECEIPLPDNWYNNWHHVVGVCTGQELKLYFNGKLQQILPVEGDLEQTEVPWNLGRNAEMPYSRRFTGMLDNVMIFKEALNDKDIWQLYNTF